LITEETILSVQKELNKARTTWHDLPKYAYSDNYEKSLTEWVNLAVSKGRKDIGTLVLYALHHETGTGKMPYFPFNRK
jgi:hypothetical protein